MRAATCPAVADMIAGARSGAGAVVCGVIALAIERDGSGGDARVEERRDDSTLAAYCTGRGIPQDVQRTHGGWVEAGERTCYTDCPVWRAEKERLERARSAELQVSGVTRPRGISSTEADRLLERVG
jgi:hypothetical protein